MALQTSTQAPAHAHAHASGAHGSHGAHAAHAASKAKPGLSAEAGEGGGFAAQLLRAQPAPDKDRQVADARPQAGPAKKPADGKDSADARDAQDAKDDKDGRDSRDADARPPAIDPNALMPWAQQIAPPTTSLADKPAASADYDELVSDPLGALRKAAGKAARPGQDDGRQSLLANLGAGRDAGAGAGVVGKGAAATSEIVAALAKAEGAVRAATEARDSLAAMLPQPDFAAVQAGAIGASPDAQVVGGPAANPAAPTPPAQATLPMTPQSPTFAPALGQQIEVWMKGGVQHAEVQLSPQDLGPIRVRIEMEGAHARVQMSADVQSTRDALQQAMPQLSEQLGQVGLSLSGGGVSDQPTFRQSQAQAQADGAFGGSGRPGAGDRAGGGASLLGDDLNLAATRQQVLRRGLLDTYA